MELVGYDDANGRGVYQFFPVDRRQIDLGGLALAPPARRHAVLLSGGQLSGLSNASKGG